eukprot:TRINITY_DN14372_c0_g1_i2.p1 TRINITY_DN14372_c0_g1~~TRINITY_DN14372_c0_g1_i2.p1  ORF type:complete len:306 (-),score=38.22 TRINITY_DN14372_c0_g1_i2:247-1164(-)
MEGQAPELILSSSNVTGFKGVYQRSGSSKYYYSKHNGAHLGSFSSAEQAAKAYTEAASIAPEGHDSFGASEDHDKETHQMEDAKPGHCSVHPCKPGLHGTGFYAKFNGRHLGTFASADEAAVAYAAAASRVEGNDPDSIIRSATNVTGFKGVYQRSSQWVSQDHSVTRQEPGSEEEESDSDVDPETDKPVASSLDLHTLGDRPMPAGGGGLRQSRRTRQSGHVPGMYKTMHHGKMARQGSLDNEDTDNHLPGQHRQAVEQRSCKKLKPEGWMAKFQGEVLGYFSTADRATEACIKEATRVLSWDE